jgi:exosome complex component RRP46
VVFPSDTSYFPEWMALRVLDLVGHSNILIRLGFLISLSYPDDVHVLASVSGPMEVRLAAENSTKATFEVSVRPLASIPGTEAKALGATIKSLLTPSLLLTRHPRTLIQLVIQPLSPSLVGSKKVMPSLHPGIAAASINASSLALMNASVTMKGVVCAAAVARTSSEELILNPSTDQLASSTTSGCFAFIFTAAELSNDRLHASEVWSNWQSSLGFDIAEMVGARELAQQGAKHIWELMKESVRSVGVHRSDDAEVKAEVTDRPPEDGGDGDTKMEI